MIDKTCLLCDDVSEIIQHLFFDCPVSKLVWREVLRHLRVQREPIEWSTERRWFIRRAKGRNQTSLRIRRMLAAAVYNIWQERNAILHSQSRTPVNELVYKFYIADRKSVV